MAERTDITLLDMVESLLQGNFGDIPRLSDIKDRLVNGKTIYNSDREYVEKKFRELPAGSTKKPDIQKAAPSQISDEKERISTDVPSNTPKLDIHIKEQPKPANKSSRAWYLLPIFLWLLGGIIAFACLRKDHPSRARNTLILGGGLSVPAISLFAILLLAIPIGDLTSEEIATVELSDDEIKRDAIQIPYESFMSDSNYEKMIHFEGEILQVQKQGFGNKYALRVGIETTGLVPSDDVWLNHKPDSSEEEQWLDNLERDGPFFFDSDMVSVWGILKEPKDYKTVFGGTRTVPQVDVLIIESKIAVDNAEDV